jgi:LPXTG-motif cell wall-anchored protein
MGDLLMKKLALLCIAALGSALLVLGTAPSASAYPEVTCDVSVDRQVVNPGDNFTATGRAVALDDQGGLLDGSNVHWTFRWNGVTKLRTGALVHATFTAPEVTHTRTIRLTARAESPQGECVHHIDITVGSVDVSAPGGGGGGLPSTGGPAFWILVAALALLLVGGGTVVVTRKRH